MDRKVRLRFIAKDDLEWARKLRNDNRNFFFDSNVVTQSAQEAWFHGLSYPFYVLEYGGERAGTVAVKSVNNGHEIHNILIDKRYRNKGLLRQAMEQLEKLYGTPLYLDVLSQNLNAIRAYKRLGFLSFSCRLQKK